VFHQGTGFYLHQVPFPFLTDAEEVETGIPQGEFFPNLGDSGDDLIQGQFFRRLIGPGGKEGGYPAVVVNPRRSPAGLCLGRGFAFFQDKTGAGNIAAPVSEEFDESARIGAMTGDSFLSIPGDDEETVGPFYKQGFPVVSEQLYGSRIAYRFLIVTAPPGAGGP
jgi:hypothetical protein